MEAQLRHILQKEKNQAHATQATRERKEEQVGKSSQVSKLKFCSFIYFNSSSFFPLNRLLDLQKEKERSHCWVLTLINRPQRCAADTDRCTGADEKFLPGRQSSLDLQRYSTVCCRTHTHAHTDTDTHKHRDSLSSHTPLLLQFPGPAY